MMIFGFALPTAIVADQIHSEKEVTVSFLTLKPPSVSADRTLLQEECLKMPELSLPTIVAIIDNFSNFKEFKPSMDTAITLVQAI